MGTETSEWRAIGTALPLSQALGALRPATRSMTPFAQDRLATIPMLPLGSPGECRVRSKRMAAPGALSRQSRNISKGVVGHTSAGCPLWVVSGRGG